MKDRKAAHNIALAIWPAGQSTIWRTKYYWASVRASRNQLGFLFLLDSLNHYRALVAGQTEL